MASSLFSSPPGGRALTFDEQWRLKNQNPFAPQTSLLGSPPTQVAPTFSDLLKGISWQNIEMNRIMNPNQGSNPLAFPGGPTPWNLAGGRAPGAAPPNPFSTLKNVKNPELQSAVDSILGQVKNLSTDPNVNQNTVKTNVKDPATASRITGAGGRFDADVNNTRQTFADFVKNFSAGLADAQNQLGTESASLDTVFDSGAGGLESRLAAMANARRHAVTNAASRAMRSASGRANSARLLGGDSSYLDAQELDALGGIGAEAAKEKADLDRLNLLSVLDARSRLLGTRGNASMNLAQRGLLPVQAGQQLAGNELAQLAGLSNLTNNNTFFNLDSPEMAMARKLGLLGQTSQLDLANNFYGLQKPYEPNASGMLPIGSPPRSGGFNFPMLDLFDTGGMGGYGMQPRGNPMAPARNPMVDQALRAYQLQTGVNPMNDPNFSEDAWNRIMGLLQPGAEQGPDDMPYVPALGNAGMYYQPIRSV